jgi:hypothetical protein
MSKENDGQKGRPATTITGTDEFLRARDRLASVQVTSKTSSSPSAPQPEALGSTTEPTKSPRRKENDGQKGRPATTITGTDEFLRARDRLASVHVTGKTSSSSSAPLHGALGSTTKSPRRTSDGEQEEKDENTGKKKKKH